jgi:hypothetical protein
MAEKTSCKSKNTRKEQSKIMKILIVGTLTNPSKKLNRDLDSILNSIDDGSEIEVHLVESDSKDSSNKYLQEQSRKRKNFSYNSLGRLKGEIPDRVERIRYSRNHYVAYIRERYSTSAWDWIIVADLDGMNSELTKKGLMSGVELLQRYDAVFANQKFGYYDLYALREKNWMPNDPITELYDRILEIEEKFKYKKFNKFRSRREIFRAKTNLVYNKMLKLNENALPIEVDSAFGGLGIYHPRIFLECDYSPIHQDLIQSEHVDFHLKARQKGFKLVINPTMINSAYNTHNINRVRLIRIIRTHPSFLFFRKVMLFKLKTRLRAE